MVLKISQILAIGKLFGNKLMLGSVAVFAVATISTASVAAASGQLNSSNTSTPANVMMCKRDYKQFGFKNSGQCVSWWNHHHGGNGYGGNGHHKHHKHHFHMPHFHFNFGAIDRWFRNLF